MEDKKEDKKMEKQETQRWLNYHHLFYFRTIATEGSIAQAAVKLRLGQPTLSAQLRQFEDTIGIKLFERQHKKLILTEQGRIALEYATEIFRMGSEMMEVLHDRLRPERTHVQVGALDSIPKQLISRLVEAAYAIGPCSVSVLEGDDGLLARELLAHRIDLILTNHRPVAEGRKLFVRSLGKLPVVICGTKKFSAIKKGFPQSLDQMPFVMPTVHSKLRHELDHFFSIQKIKPEIVAETQDTSLSEILGRKSLGLLPISSLAAQGLNKGTDLIQLGTIEGITEELFLVAANRRIENPISAQLLKKFSL